MHMHMRMYIYNSKQPWDYGIIGREGESENRKVHKVFSKEGERKNIGGAWTYRHCAKLHLSKLYSKLSGASVYC